MSAEFNCPPVCEKCGRCHRGDCHANQQSSLAPAQCSAAGVDKQDATDWQHFAKVFKSKEGCEPTRRDSKAEMCYEYYTAGAHDEFLGRLNQKQPNEKSSG